MQGCLKVTYYGAHACCRAVCHPRCRRQGLLKLASTHSRLVQISLCFSGQHTVRLWPLNNLASTRKRQTRASGTMALPSKHPYASASNSAQPKCPMSRRARQRRRLQAGKLELREVALPLGTDDMRLPGTAAPGTAAPGAMLLRPATPAERGGNPRLMPDDGTAPSVAVVMLRLAPPFAAVSTVLTFAAKRSEQRLSNAEAGSGLMLTNMSVFPSPPRQGCSRYVSLLLRYGTCALLFASACKPDTLLTMNQSTKETHLSGHEKWGSRQTKRKSGRADLKDVPEARE